MKFSADIFITCEKGNSIPSTYRRNFASLIKEAINPDKAGTEIYQQYYDKNKREMKPFTFSVSFSAAKEQGSKGFINLSGNNLGFHFSSCDPVFLIHVYNGLVGMKNGYPLFRDCKTEIRHFRLVPDKKIDRDEAVFKTYSPVLVREFDAGRKATGYITSDHPDFRKNLFYSTKRLCAEFIDKSYALRDWGGS